MGLYTIALANRVGPRGQVWAFEPDPDTLAMLRRHVALNGVGSIVKVLPYAVGDRDGKIAFTTGRETESHVALELSGHDVWVHSVRLDTLFAHTSLDLLKIDVEGFEEHVLRGARGLLADAHRAPRTMFIEVHPFAWEQYRVCSRSLLELLHSLDYEIYDLAGNCLDEILHYGEIVARLQKGNKP